MRNYAPRWLVLKAYRKVADAALLQEKVDHDATKVKSVTDQHRLTVEAAHSYDSRFNQALEQIKILYPDVDTSVCDILKEVVGGVLVDLIVGESGNNAATGKDDDVVDKEAQNTNTEVREAEAEIENEYLGNAFCS
ncbi:hypothetical protein SESBI_32580 [Sesbania bispinosa]|nr:hypothetical protein SESBI_32580 [Sesbania bispinosa]